MTDFCIVGQGIAGSLLAWQLIKRHKSVVVIDDHHKHSSSMVSIGLINPITGKRFTVAPRFDLLYSVAQKTYAELETSFGKEFFVPKPILRFFKTNAEYRRWVRQDKLALARNYVEESFPPNTHTPLLQDTFGSIRVTQGGLCHTASLLEALTDYFRKIKSLAVERFVYDDLKIGETSVQYRGEHFRYVIFCEGYQSQFNPWLSDLPFNSAKGEIIRVHMEDAALPDTILNKGKWFAPLGDNTWAGGANYIWDDLNCEPTAAGKKEILDGLDAFIKHDKRLIRHDAAVRPVMKDQKPVMGLHPQHPRLGLLNGLGSKGFLMAPYYSQHLADFLTGQGQLDENISVKRFLKLRKGI